MHRVELVGGRHALAAPRGWRVSAAPGRSTTIVVEPRPSGFASSVVASVAPRVPDPAGGGGDVGSVADEVAAAMAPTVRPVLLDVQQDDGGRDVRLLLTHLVEETSVTAAQRQLVTPRATLVVTVSAATDRWHEVWQTAQAVLDSLEETP